MTSAHVIRRAQQRIGKKDFGFDREQRELSNRFEQLKDSLEA